MKCRYDNKAPDPVTAPSADDEGSGGAILLTFTASASPTCRSYRVYRSENAGSFDEAQAAGHIGETAARGTYPGQHLRQGQDLHGPGSPP